MFLSLLLDEVLFIHCLPSNLLEGRRELKENFLFGFSALQRRTEDLLTSLSGANGGRSLTPQPCLVKTALWFLILPTAASPHPGKCFCVGWAGWR